MVDVESMTTALALYWWHKYWEADQMALWVRVVDAVARILHMGLSMRDLMQCTMPLHSLMPSFWKLVLNMGRRLWPMNKVGKGAWVLTFPLFYNRALTGAHWTPLSKWVQVLLSCGVYKMQHWLTGDGVVRSALQMCQLHEVAGGLRSLQHWVVARSKIFTPLVLAMLEEEREEIVPSGKVVWWEEGVCDKPAASCTVAAIRKQLVARKFKARRAKATIKRNIRWSRLGEVNWGAVWRAIASVYTPKRTRDTVWHMLQGGLYTRDRLVHMAHTNDERFCQVCDDKATVEDPQHMYLDCPVARACWRRLGKILGPITGAALSGWLLPQWWQWTCGEGVVAVGWKWVVRLCIFQLIQGLWQHRTDLMYNEGKRNPLPLPALAVAAVIGVLVGDIYVHGSQRLEKRGLSEAMWVKLVKGSKWDWIQFKHKEQWVQQQLPRKEWRAEVCDEPVVDTDG